MGTVLTDWSDTDGGQRQWASGAANPAPWSTLLIVYSDDLAGVTLEQLTGFFVGWPDPPAPETHLRLLAGSSHRLLARDETTGRVVGFVTAISDGVLAASIPALEVLPAYQGRGIGGELLRGMLERLRGLYMVDLVCDPELQPFYARFGMRPAPAMILRAYERQSGLPAGTADAS